MAGGRGRQDADRKVSTRLEMGVPQGRGHIRSQSPPNRSQEKPVPDNTRARTKTDTGRRDEDSKALERTLVKELGKLTP